jgi:minor histocompatibility antigen H13
MINPNPNINPNPDQFMIGYALLSGLFFYDIFWVFGTDVMVTVAKTFDGPAKLLFPMQFQPELKTSLLGLGDIIIPGFFMALTYRFDAWLRYSKRNTSSWD